MFGPRQRIWGIIERFLTSLASGIPIYFWQIEPFRNWFEFNRWDDLFIQMLNGYNETSNETIKFISKEFRTVMFIHQSCFQKHLTCLKWYWRDKLPQYWILGEFQTISFLFLFHKHITELPNDSWMDNNYHNVILSLQLSPWSFFLIETYYLFFCLFVCFEEWNQFKKKKKPGHKLSLVV